MSSIVAYWRRLLPSGVVFRVIRTLITAVSGTPATDILKPMIARTVMAHSMTSLAAR